MDEVTLNLNCALYIVYYDMHKTRDVVVMTRLDTQDGAILMRASGEAPEWTMAGRPEGCLEPIPKPKGGWPHPQYQVEALQQHHEASACHNIMSSS